MKRTYRSSPPRRQRGLTLVELMVGLAVGMVLVAGLALLFANTSQSGNELEKSLRQIENGRYAIDLLGEDLSVAGYFGEAMATGSAATVSPCAGTADVVADLEAKRAATPAVLPDAVQGLTPAEAAALTCLADHLAGTPAVVVRRLDTTAIATTEMTPGEVYVQSSNHASETTATYRAATDAADLALKDMDGTINRVRRYVLRVYYVAGCSDCGRDTIPTLKRAELRAGGIVVAPIAEGIDNLGLDYGFDTTGDGAPDTWLGLNGAADMPEATAAAALGWGNVMAVRVHLVTRTTEPTPGFVDERTYSMGLRGTSTFVVTPAASDAFKRRVYTTTVRLNSLAGARE
jgi:type IV pilus assembly protein PilW